MRLVQMARNLLVAVSPPVLLILGGKGPWGSVLLVCPGPQTPLCLPQQLLGWYASQIFDQWRSITSNRFVLNMV